MKAEASRLAALALGRFAFVVLLAGCSLVLGDLPPTTDEPDETKGGGSSGAGATGGSGAEGGAGGTGQGGGDGGGSSGSGGIPAGCDEDRDGVASDTDTCGGDDCDDSNEEVYPGQADYFPMPRSDGSGTFDYNCDANVEQEPLVQCVLVGGECPQNQGFLDDVACGQVGRWGTCTLVSPALCMAEVLVQEQARGCR